MRGLEPLKSFLCDRQKKRKQAKEGKKGREGGKGGGGKSQEEKSIGYFFTTTI